VVSVRGLGGGRGVDCHDGSPVPWTYSQRLATSRGDRRVDYSL
jgi:hypothetical protein